MFHPPFPEVPPPPLPFPPAVENICITPPCPTNSVTKSSGAGKIMRRVSNIFTSRKKIEPRITIVPLQTPLELWRAEGSATASDSDVSFDDIRRPSGLGRAVSISSNRSLPPSPFAAFDEESPFFLATTVGYERLRTMSSPNPLRFAGTKTKGTQLTRSSSAARRRIVRHVPQIPREILIIIFSYLPRHTIASLATTSRIFSTVARTLFYEKLDVSTLRPSQVEALVTLLAYRQDLTDLVRTFECHEWPVFFPLHHLNGAQAQQPPSFSPALTATFTIAFQNMSNITSLVLPSFDYPFLRHHSAFGLRRLTFLCSSVNAAETTRLFAWLEGQTNITHLAFPNLLDPTDTPTSSVLADIPKGPRYPNGTLTDSLNTHGIITPNITPSSSPTTPVLIVSPVKSRATSNSSALLPALMSLVATPSFVTTLIATGASGSSRPLQKVILNVNNTLYTGLRPAALLSALHGITTLVLRFHPTVDKRTIGKLLSAGAALSSPEADVQDAFMAPFPAPPGNTLRMLELELSQAAPGIDQVRIAHMHVLSPPAVNTNNL
ncbi:hypothetical protein H0H81_010645 [Sphagnurus paluster]|uniref:F-box domain-containing protein n=1 Tax=Sphagnurus paluster TaxID=117069 RepID=A0A9P7FVJ5_9AGAR|nr:hypothetical protein H0H81_010645 [Sphagnurus paluster]